MFSISSILFNLCECLCIFSHKTVDTLRLVIVLCMLLEFVVCVRVHYSETFSANMLLWSAIVE